MSLLTHMNFQKTIFEKLGFEPAALDFGTRWSRPGHPENGSCLVFERPGFYVLTIADYKVPATFMLHFSNARPILRFGSFCEGKTFFQIEGLKTNSSSPVNFIVREQNIRGTQYWNKNGHFQGVEIALSPEYIQLLRQLDSNILALEAFAPNIPQNALPSQVVAALKQLSGLAFSDGLTPLMLEGILTQCLGILTKEAGSGYFQSTSRSFAIFLGKRKLSFTDMDYEAIHKAHRIITDHPEKNLTISGLCREVFLNEQKLKTGFALCYHTTIGAYLKDCRMAHASEMLIHTDLSVHAVARASGYASSAGFIKAFRQKYHITPLHFRAHSNSCATDFNNDRISRC